MHFADIDEKDIQNVYDNDYFKLSKQLLMFVGVWPYKLGKSKIRRFAVYLNLTISSTFVIMGIKMWCGKDMDICCENIIGVLYLAMVFTKFQATILIESMLKEIYEYIALIWLTTENPEEKAIMEKYAKLGYFKAKTYFVLIILTGLGFSQLPMIPIVLDIINPLNESREKILFIRAEFMVDQFEHYYKIYFYCIISIIITVPAFTCSDVSYTVVTHQSLAMLSIVQHRIQLATQDCNKRLNSSYNNIIQAIILHVEALKFMNLIETSYSMLLLFISGIGIISMATVAILLMGFLNDAIYSNVARIILGMICVLIHMFYISWPGQMLIDHSEQIFLSIYTNEWYNISQKEKVLLQILMLKCIKPCTFTAGNVYIMSFENFGTIVKTILTYITSALSFRDN